MRSGFRVWVPPVGAEFAVALLQPRSEGNVMGGGPRRWCLLESFAETFREFRHPLLHPLLGELGHLLEFQVPPNRLAVEKNVLEIGGNHPRE